MRLIEGQPKEAPAAAGSPAPETLSGAGLPWRWRAAGVPAVRLAAALLAAEPTCCAYLLSGVVTLADAFMFSAPTIQAYCSSFEMNS